MNYVFIFQSKGFFSQGGVLQFWGILVSYGEKIGYIGIPVAPWLSLIDVKFVPMTENQIRLTATGACLSEVSVITGPEKLFYACHVYIYDQKL